MNMLEALPVPMPPVVEVDSWSEPDWFLQMWANLVNKSDMEFPVTLMVRGLIISGTIIGGQEYLATVAEGIVSESRRRGFNEASLEVLTTAFDELGAAYYDPQPDDDESEPEPPTYIHLKDVKILSPTGIHVNFPGVCWRGRLASVDGYMMASVVLVEPVG